MSSQQHPNFENEVIGRFDQQDQQIKTVLTKLNDHDARLKVIEAAKLGERVKNNEEGIAALVEEVKTIKQLVGELPTTEDIKDVLVAAIDDRNLFYVKWLGSRTGKLMGVVIIAGAGALGKELVELLF